eukprot:4946240-Alexandrium_andersonii.AAC.1
MHDAVKIFHCAARVGGDCLAAATALARSSTFWLGPSQVLALVALQASPVHWPQRQYGPSPPGEHTVRP